MKNKIVLAAKILAIVTISLISFAGIYVQRENKMENILKEFTLSKDLKGYREITLAAVQEEEESQKEKLTTENYEKSKKIIQTRLEKMNVKDYNIALDKQTGLIYIQLPEDENTDKVVGNISQIGDIEIKDSENADTVLLSSDKFKTARVGYQTKSNVTAVILELIFNQEGTDTLKNLSENEYKTIENTTATNTDTTENEKNNESESEKSTQKEVAIYMSGQQITTTSFDETIEDGTIKLTVGQVSTDIKQIESYKESAETVATILNSGILPIEYDIEENQYVKTDITTESIKNVLTVISITVAILLIYMIIKHKAKGLLAALGYIGYIALYLLLLRYCNVTIALEGIVAGVICAILQYLFIMKLLEIHSNKNKKLNKEYTKLIIKLIPILAISIIFCFVKVTVLESFGMVMFWGLVLSSIYNVLVAKYLID